MAVEVNDPADFPRHLGAAEKAALLPIQPIPLHPHLKRESLLESALLLTIAHFPRNENHRAECLEFAMGLRLKQRECEGKQLVQFCGFIVTVKSWNLVNDSPWLDFN